jgi:hypothetical protein
VCRVFTDGRRGKGERGVGKPPVLRKETPLISPNQAIKNPDPPDTHSFTFFS